MISNFGWLPSWIFSAFSSACCRSAGIFAQLSRPRHLGNPLQPSHGPRLPVRRFIIVPHLGQGRSVRYGLGDGNLMPPFLSMFRTNSVSRLTLVRKSPKRPVRRIIGAPSTGQRMSTFSGRSGLPWRFTGAA